MILALNVIACVLQLTFAVWANCYHRFNDGLLMKSGLFLVAITSTDSVFISMQNPETIDWNTTLTNIGIAIIFLSMCWRRIMRRVRKYEVASNS